MRGFKADCLNVVRLFGLAAAVALSPATSSAADPQVSGQLVPLANVEQVTLSRPATTGAQALVTYAAYVLTINNNTPTSLNRLYVSATAQNVGGTDPVVFDSTIINGLPGACAGFGTSTISCETNLSLAAGQSTSAFILVVQAPVNGEQIRIQWSAGGHEGNGAGNGCCAVTGSPALTTLVNPATDPSFATRVKSFVKNSGGTLFTGAGGVATATDKWTTTVKVPAFGATFTTAEVLEELNPPNYASCSAAYNNFCVTSDLTIPGSFASLEIILRRDVSTIKNGSKIADAVLFYFPDGGGLQTQINDCQAGQPNETVRRCVSARKVYSKKDAPTPEYEGDWEFTVGALENGRIAW